MSFWDNVKKFAQPYADDEYDEYDDDEYMDDYEEEEQPARRPSRRQSAPAPVSEAPSFNFSVPSAAPAAPAAPAATAAPAAASTGFTGAVLNRTTGAKQEVVLFRPTSFNDTPKAADDLKANKAVIVNMENVDKAMARRVVDFLSGCVYALEGDVKKIAQSAYLFCPHNVGIVGNLEAIQAEAETYI